ncbi:MAG TPA: macro domain-containing protein [Coriobacteriia bacterium]|nr:macro domain-containing protein [Coriobacteriia bacterium]
MEPITLPNGATITLKRGDITGEAADAIVNAANGHLLPGGGVSGAIHDAAGPDLERECSEVVRQRGSLATGEAVMTAGYDLPAAHVIHAVGPVWSGGGDSEAEALSSAYRSAIEIADEGGLNSVAFPSISTGIYGYPLGEAAPVALESVVDALGQASNVRTVTFVLYDAATYAAYEIASRPIRA